MSFFRKRAFNKSNDLIPAIGSKGDDGGWCLVQHRVNKSPNFTGKKDFNNFLLKNINVDKYPQKKQIEQGAYKIIQLDPTGEEKDCFTEIQLEPHSQMMMDFRGVTLDSVQMATNIFIPLYKKFMLLNYEIVSKGVFRKKIDPPVDVSGMKPCSGIDEKRKQGKECFEIVLSLNKVKYVFSVEDKNENAELPYQMYNRLLILTSHSTEKQIPHSGIGCDIQTGDLIKQYSDPESSWSGGGIVFAPQQQKRKASIQRVARLYMRSKFDQ